MSSRPLLLKLYKVLTADAAFINKTRRSKDAKFYIVDTNTNVFSD